METTRKTVLLQDNESVAHESYAKGSDGTRLYVRHRPGLLRTTAVLCDGLACDGFIYKYLWGDLAALGLSVAHFHYRGHGRSGNPIDRDRIDVSAHAADLDAVRRHLGDPPVVLVGHSFGTQVALEGYRARATGVSAIISLCGSFGRVTYTFKGTQVLADLLPNLMQFAARHPRVARGLWSRFPPRTAVNVGRLMGDIHPEVKSEDVEPYFHHISHFDCELFLRMLQQAGEHSAADYLPQVRVPVLVLAGEKDSFTLPSLSQAMAELIPGAEFASMSGGTHVAPLEQPEWVAERIQRFLLSRGVLPSVAE